jgi:hypothetical protein
MDDRCPECGAALAGVSSCQEHFYAMLALEAEIPGGPTGEAHFYAVASYGLQHPAGMGYTAATLAGLRRSLARQLAGEATLDQIRRHVRREANGPQRVLRREGDQVPSWPLSAWPMSVADVLAAGAARYEALTAAWARSIISTLDQAGA